VLKINLKYIIVFRSTIDSYILDHQQCYHFSETLRSRSHCVLQWRRWVEDAECSRALCSSVARRENTWCSSYSPIGRCESPKPPRRPVDLLDRRGSPDPAADFDDIAKHPVRISRRQHTILDLMTIQYLSNRLFHFILKGSSKKFVFNS
jgi:hypothetical protein